MSRILYRAILGEEFDRLPPQIRDMHRFAARAKGTAGVSQGRSWAARLICRLTRLPRPASNVPVETSFEPLETGERWTRRFDGQPFQTDMLPGTRESFPCMLERLGPFLFKMRVTATAEGIDLTPEQVLLGPLRIPPALAPRPLGRERVVDGHYHFFPSRCASRSSGRYSDIKARFSRASSSRRLSPPRIHPHSKPTSALRLRPTETDSLSLA
ncbi:DUF4166 domain-containing protein [Roseibium salinum]|nr:DUF4166 domain-containing protein [Roseibium salinum]